jgi:auxin responsive protein
MISTKKLIKMARKWKKLAAASRRRISGPATTMANKGHFVIYTTDDGRFMIPLLYLKSETMRELLRMAEEEFGLISDGPITLPCDSTSMEYVLSILQQHASENLEKAIILSLKSCCSSLLSSTLQHDHRNQQLLISSF